MTGGYAMYIKDGKLHFDYNFLDGVHYHLTSPPAVHGKRYRVVVVKPVTGEEASAPTLLAGVDDTRPTMLSATGLAYTQPTQLVFDEPMQAAGMPTLGSDSFTSANPDFGAVFTYFLDQPFQTARDR